MLSAISEQGFVSSQSEHFFFSSPPAPALAAGAVAAAAVAVAAAIASVAAAVAAILAIVWVQKKAEETFRDLKEWRRPSKLEPTSHESYHNAGDTNNT